MPACRMQESPAVATVGDAACTKDPYVGAPNPANEDERLACLCNFNILDTVSCDLTQHASQLLLFNQTLGNGTPKHRSCCHFTYSSESSTGWPPATHHKAMQISLTRLCLALPLPQAPETRFDSITKLCSTIFKVPIALVSLVQDERQWFKSVVGLDASQTDRNSSFCAWCVRSSQAPTAGDACGGRS